MRAPEIAEAETDRLDTRDRVLDVAQLPLCQLDRVSAGEAKSAGFQALG